MAVKIRLLRVGKTKQPSYRVVVADARSPRDGRIIETIGHYGPRAEPSHVDIDAEKALAWLRQGAQPTESVQKLLTVTGVWATYEGEKQRPIVTKLNRRGHMTGRGPAPQAKPEPAPTAASPATEPAPAAEAEPAADAAAAPATADAAPPATADAEPETPAAGDAADEEPSA